MAHEAAAKPAHVLLIPLPIQGPVNCMLKLAELLCLAGLNVTFLNTVHNHRLLTHHTNIRSRFAQYGPSFRFITISDGLPEDNPRSAEFFVELTKSFESSAKPFLTEILISCDIQPAVTCVIADGLLSFAFDVAEDFKVPFIYFETISPCCLWVYLRLPQLVESGEVPFQGSDLDKVITSVPGMEGLLRRRDLPGLCRVNDLTEHNFQLALMEAERIPRAQGLILNTFADLEEPLLSLIRSYSSNLYSIGPLHTHLKTRLVAAEEASRRPHANNYSNSFRQEDRSCIIWLNSQQKNSVIYVSFGSLTVTTKEQHLEIWHGLINSGKKFLWVIRSDGIQARRDETMDDHHITKELEQGTRERGYIVDWAPQEEVLAHPAVAAFLTHSGWNSTMESIVEGVPMICWPHYVDQLVNSRFVSEVWKIGLEMKDVCDRKMIQEMIVEVMEKRAEEFRQIADNISALAQRSVKEKGSSYCDLDRLVDDIIRKLSLKA